MIRPRQKLGKYQIEKKLGEGGFAAVYRARDTIEGVRVALKIPHSQLVNSETLEDFRKEVRLLAGLNHPHVLPLKNAEFIDGHFVIAFPLGERTLEERLQYRLSTELALSFIDQILQAVSFAHEHRIIHCDIKPENLILFQGNHLLLSDFGIAKVALHTIRGSGSGTVGHVAPEQAMGKPSFCSDVFSIGLIAYRMFSGVWPEWPFPWPPEGIERVRKKASPALIDWLRKSMEIQPRDRFRDATQMKAAFDRIRRQERRGARQSGGNTPGAGNGQSRDWKTLRFKQFRVRFGKELGPFHDCPRCSGPIAEAMTGCPWCAAQWKVFPYESRFPQICPRCCRGLKLDWSYCPWCYGSGFEVPSSREWPDRRYVARCGNTKCSRRDLMRFMRYCPWCRRKVRQKWKLEGSSKTCGSCGWGVADDFWSHCPWCGDSIS